MKQNNNPLQIITKDNLGKILYNMHNVPNARYFDIKATIDRVRQ